MMLIGAFRLWTDENYSTRIGCLRPMKPFVIITSVLHLFGLCALSSTRCRRSSPRLRFSRVCGKKSRLKGGSILSDFLLSAQCLGFRGTLHNRVCCHRPALF